MKQLRFKIVRDRHFALGNLLGCSTDEAQLAMAQAFSAIFACRANWRAKDTAGHGPPRVYIAAAGRGVECGACGIVSEIFEACLVIDRTAECAGVSIAGKIRTVFGEPGAGAVGDFGSERGICDAQLGHPGAQARGIERVNGKGSVTALRAPDATCKERFGAAGCLGERGIQNLHKLDIARWKGG